MPTKIRYHCLNCGREFEASVLSEEEKREALRRDESLSPISCPYCRRRDYRKISN